MHSNNFLRQFVWQFLKHLRSPCLYTVTHDREQYTGVQPPAVSWLTRTTSKACSCSTRPPLHRKPMGMGTLYISEARVSWVGIQGQGFSLEYKHVALHAVSR